MRKLTILDPKCVMLKAVRSEFWNDCTAKRTVCYCSHLFLCHYFDYRGPSPHGIM